MLEPLGVVVRPVFESEVGMSTVCVTGCGPIGQFAIALASALGAYRIYAVDINPMRLELARKNGATDVINSKDYADFSEIILKETGGIDAVIEASGNEHVINEGLHTLLRGARMFMVGNPHGDITIKDNQGQLGQKYVLDLG